MAKCKASRFPFLLGIKLGKFGASPLVDNSLYKQLVGSILYLIESQNYLKYVVGDVSRYVKNPNQIHLKDSKRILHYMQGTRQFGVHYVVGSPLELVGFTDSDCARDPIDMK